eukprot:11306376-Alexandrium_andersonii.AAC.1
MEWHLRTHYGAGWEAGVLPCISRCARAAGGEAPRRLGSSSRLASRSLASLSLVSSCWAASRLSASRLAAS